jgi:hypothetical protein
MMNTTHLAARVRRFGVAALAVVAAGCSDFLTVPNPTVIDASAIDPVQDAATLANSAQQNYIVFNGLGIMYSSWFVGETIVAETFPTRNEFGRRDIVNVNGSLNTDVWVPLQRALSSARFVLGLSLPSPTTNISRAQAAMFAGFSFLNMAEQFCEGTFALSTTQAGPRMNTNAMLDSAIASFNLAITIGRANGTATGVAYKNASFVGLARAQLQRGNNALASTAADSVPAGFTFNLNHIDDLAQRNRLANQMWIFTRDRGSISVSSTFRPTPADPRVPFQDGLTFTPVLSAQDPLSGTFFVQLKYPGYTAPIRLASRLEADYIKAEIGTDADKLALIAARRTAAGLPAYTGATTGLPLLTELFTQKGFDFFLEGKRIADFRRQPTAIVGVPVAGAAYFKPGFSPIGNNTCYPVPFAETSTNPAFQ